MDPNEIDNRSKKGFQLSEQDLKRSPLVKRTIEACKQLQKRMKVATMNKTVEQAVEDLQGDPANVGSYWPGAGYLVYSSEKERYDWWVGDFQSVFGWTVVCSLQTFNQAAAQWKARRVIAALRERRRAREAGEWVDGLPPVNCECEAAWLVPPDGGERDFEVVMVKGYSHDAYSDGNPLQKVWLETRRREDVVVHLSNVTFQAILSDRDKAIEEIKAAMGRNPDEVTLAIDLNAASVYDAGYRKQMSRAEALSKLSSLPEDPCGHIDRHEALDALGFND